MRLGALETSEALLIEPRADLQTRQTWPWLHPIKGPTKIMGWLVGMAGIGGSF